MNELLIPNQPAFRLLDADESKATNLMWSLAVSSDAVCVVRRLRGDKMPFVADLFDKFSAALQFPYYFGENWSAFDECITDLEWLPGNAYILWITSPNKLLAMEPENRAVFLKILLNAAEEWAKPVEKPYPFSAPLFSLMQAWATLPGFNPRSPCPLQLSPLPEPAT